MIFKAFAFAARLLTVGCLFLSSLGAYALPAYYDNVTGLEWRQLTETRNLSIAQLMNGAVRYCSYSTGICNGTVDGVDLTGWTLATPTDVTHLFYDFSGPNAIPGWTTSSGYQNIVPASSNFGQNILSSAFDSLLPFAPIGSRDPVSGYVQGWILLPNDLSSAGLAEIIAGPDRATLCGDGCTDPNYLSGPQVGIWMYRTAQTGTVPEPGTIFLILIGFVGLWKLTLPATRSGNSVFPSKFVSVPTRAGAARPQRPPFVDVPPDRLGLATDG